eukprot:gene19249-biopygen22653
MWENHAFRKRTDASGACKDACLPLGECRDRQCRLTCRGTQACEGLVVRTDGTCVRPAECVSIFACKALRMQACASVGAPDASPDLRCRALSACRDAVIPLGPCPPSAPCPLSCINDRACSGLTVSTRGTCIQPPACEHDAACAGLRIRCGGVRMLEGALPALHCTARDACKGAVIPLGDCTPPVGCELACSAEGACQGLRVSTNGTC